MISSLVNLPSFRERRYKYINIPHTYSERIAVQEKSHLSSMHIKTRTCLKTKNTKNAERWKETECFQNQKFHIEKKLKTESFYVFLNIIIQFIILQNTG